jgi:hypothetical protein
MNGQTFDGKHLQNSVTVAHGLVGKEKTVTLSCQEVQTQRVALSHLSPDEARAVAMALMAQADFVDGVQPVAPADPGEVVERPA